VFGNRVLRAVFGPKEEEVTGRRKLRSEEFNKLFSSQIVFSLWLYSPLDLGGFFSFLILYTVCRTPWAGDQPVTRLLPTHRTTQTE
jgi:hypothetical protein